MTTTTTLAETTTPEGAEKLEDRAWMSRRIRKSEDWIAHNMARVPHIKVGRDVWFTETHAQMFLKAHEVLPEYGRTERSRNSRRAR